MHSHKTVTQSNSISPNAILQLGSGFFASRVLLTAVGLGLFTELASGPLEGERLRSRLGLHPRAARDFFDALVALRMLDRRDGVYANTPETDRYLDRNKPSYIGAWLDMADRRLFCIWASLPAALKTGLPQNEFAEADPFAAMYADAEATDTFAREMTAVTRPVADALVRDVTWDRYRSVIDIGTAQGALPVAVATAHPHMAGGGFDLPPVRPVFERCVASHGLSNRLQFYPGDFRSDPLPSADVLTMGHILVDWDVSMKQHLIQKAYTALPAGGALVIYDMMIDDDRRQNAMALLMSLNMLLETVGGGEYTADECREWMRAAGFSRIDVRQLPLSHSMITAVK